MSQLPFCNGTLLTINAELDLEEYGNHPGGRAFYTGILYIVLGFIGLPVNCFVLSVFCRAPLIHESIYKLLTITTCLDILNIITACFVSGVASVLNISYCDPAGAWLYPYSVYFMFHWYAYCAASEVLAVNRVLIFARPGLVSVLFDGKRAWFWLIFILGYATAGTVAKPAMFYVYDPVSGVFFDGDNNPFHIYNNFIKLAFVTACYLIVIAFLIKIGKGTNSAAQRSLSLQTLVIAFLAALSTVGYLGVSYLPPGNALAKYSGLIGQLGWILLHTFSGFVYLVGNQTVRRRFLWVIGRRQKTVSVVTVTAITSITRRRG